MKKIMTVIKRKCNYGNDGGFYFKDKEGKKYYWSNSSDKVYAQLDKGITKEFIFEETGERIEGITVIKNVSWKQERI